MSPETKPVSEDIERTKKQILSVPIKDDDLLNPNLLGFVISQFDKHLGRESRLRFLSFIFDRTLTTSKAETEGGLSAREGIQLIKWAQPAKIHEEGPWTVDRCVKIACMYWKVDQEGQMELPL